MKSKKARELIDLNLFERKYNDGITRLGVRLDVVEEAFELAESELLETHVSKEKAIEAFNKVVADLPSGLSKLYYLNLQREFTQKLNE